ncbi:MAG: UbiA family prenyltransferase [Ktedonobacteraceae bacterium]
MQSKKRSFSDIALGFLLLTHPGPVSLFIATVALFALRATWPRPVWSVILLLLAAHAAMQFSISMINDYCDRALDAISKPDKPIIRGLVTPREALTAGIVMIVLMFVLLLPLPPLATVVSLCYLALGQAYNLGLKSTAWSGIVLALMIALIPLYVFAGAGRTLPLTFWFAVVVMGFLGGVALNVANSLPDLEGDETGGSRTLTVVLGLKRSFLVSPLIIVSLIILSGILTLFGFVPAQLLIMLPIWIITAVGLAVILLFFGPNKPKETRKIYFYLARLTCVVLISGWFVAIQV